MPALQNDINSTFSSLSMQQQNQNQTNQSEEAPIIESSQPQPEPQSNNQIRELTQTDKLNKVLLKAFLNRINNGEVDLTFQQTNTSSTSSSFDNDSAGN